MIHLKLVRTTPDRFWFGPGLKNVALGWNEKRLLKYRRFEASALMPWIYSVRWRHINQWPCRHPMKDHLLVVIYAIQSVSLFWRENFDFKFMISDHKWLNRKLIKTFLRFQNLCREENVRVVGEANQAVFLIFWKRFLFDFTHWKSTWRDLFSSFSQDMEINGLKIKLYKRCW